MRTLSKGNFRVVYDPAKGESMSMIAVYKKNLDGTLSQSVRRWEKKMITRF